uniref:DNA polymerase III subunit delta n=1 Tax=Altererythrobacter segetis TaxID=1104773 RepID=UPI0014081C38|nr:DNA polymerase III subunit delta [Altererythrobacter segetis]
MKATQKDFRQVAPRAARECRIFFFCGPDEAGAAAAATAIAALLPDAGERLELSGGELRPDPARLGDESRSGSLFGDARHIYVRANGDDVQDAVRLLLETIDAGDGDGACPVLIVASAATDKSRTAKLLEKRGDALVAMFYPPDLSTIAAEVSRMAGAAGLKMTGGLHERIARACGLDLRLAQSEIDKLALYCDASPQAPKEVRGEDLDAIGAGTEEEGFMPLVNAVLSGDAARVPAELRRMRELSLGAVGVLLAFERRAAQLAQLAGRLGTRSNIGEFVDGERRSGRIFWRDAGDLKAQLAFWRGKRLDRLVRRLAATHRTLLGNSAAAETLLAQELSEIARKPVNQPKNR